MFEVGAVEDFVRAPRRKRENICLPVFEEHLSGKPYRIADTIMVSDELDDVRATPCLIAGGIVPCPPGGKNHD